MLHRFSAAGAPIRIERGNVSMRLIAIAFAIVFWFGAVEAQERTITVASTTSTEQSGLFGYLLPRFLKDQASV
jgi:ABC-type tungstate transport system permease subunit